MREPLKLTIEEDSPTWKSICRWADSRIDQHLRELESVGMEPDVYDRARGAVQELRLLTKLATDRNKK